MYKINISKQELEELKKLKKQEKNKRVYRRLQCIHLAAKGKENKEIADIIGVCVDTVTDWIKIYLDEGIVGICKLDFTGRREAAINGHVGDIKKDIEKNNISTLAQLQNWIKDKYEINLEQSWLFRCCKKNSIFLTRKHA